MLLDFHYELVRPIPALIIAAQDRAAVDCVEIDAIKAAAIHHVGMVGRDLLEEG
jgi:ABC-type phosphate/phosphonate transport system permease subunit